MYAYAKYCPVAAATQVVGDYWTPLIVRELLYGTDRFNQLVRNLPNISRTLLASRLRALERGGVLECRRNGSRNATSYHLTPAGRDLQRLISAMNEWGSQWGTPDPDPADLDPEMAICMLKDRIRTSALPNERIVIEIVSVGDREVRGWLVCDKQAVSMCVEPPGFDTDVWIKAGVPVLYQIWLQQTSMSEALKLGRVEAEGPPGLLKRLPNWFESEARSPERAITRGSSPSAAPIA